MSFGFKNIIPRQSRPAPQKRLLPGKRLQNHPPTRVRPLSFSYSDMIWLNCKAWESLKKQGECDDFDFFYKGYCNADADLKRSPPWIAPRANRHPLQVATRWVLRQNMKEPIGWAEAREQGEGFATIELLFGFAATATAIDRSMALAQLIGPCLILGEADTLVLLPAHESDRALALALPGIIPKQVWIPQLHRKEVLRSTMIGIIETPTWWASELGKKTRHQFTYLERQKSQTRGSNSFR